MPSAKALSATKVCESITDPLNKLKPWRPRTVVVGLPTAVALTCTESATMPASSAMDAVAELLVSVMDAPPPAAANPAEEMETALVVIVGSEFAVMSTSLSALTEVEDPEILAKTELPISFAA